MAKYYGVIGFVTTVETAPGVWTEKIVEKHFAGDLLSYSRRWQNGSYKNDNLAINNKISIVFDAYAYQHIGEMRYVELMGSYWKIDSIDVEHPRMILSIGEVYNGKQARTA